MNDEHSFRVAVIIGAVVFLPIGAYYRLRAHATGERLDRSPEGLFLLVTLRPVGMMAGLGVLAYVIDPDWMAWSSLALPAWLRWTGVALGLTAGSLLTWTLRSLGPNLTDTVVTRKTHTLVTHGPYRSVRHPFYLSVAAAVAASALASANWFVLASGTLWFLLMVMRTAREEERLLARFGDAYRAYAGRAGRFLPSCGKRTREGR